MYKGLFFLMGWCVCTLAMGQDYELQSTTDVYKDLKKLHRGLRVLYIAAHPDDENTRLISWLENDQFIETAYLSLTRGEGGQNLIGDEKGDALGVLRTYELLEARKVDGGEQFFTRAVDFGYSKSAQESFEKWGKNEVLSDVVYVIRKFRPHVIVNRFPPTRDAGHGHHEASAILSAEAFELAGNKEAFPEQLKTVQPWQPTALYLNTSSWWRKELDEKSADDLKAEKIHRVNIGVFDLITGMAVNEIAALARSKHRCQAFGSARDRGERFEYLQLVKGEWKDDLFESMTGVWERSPAHKDAIGLVLGAYDFTSHLKNLAMLQTHVLPKIAQRSLWAEPMDISEVNERVQQMRLDMTGARVEIYAGEDAVVTGESYPVTAEVYNAGKETLQVQFEGVLDTMLTIEPGRRVEWKETLVAPRQPSGPYWLREPHGDLYAMAGPELSGLPEQGDERIPYTITAGGVSLQGYTTLHRRWTDRSVGEIVKPMLFAPALVMETKATSMAVPVGKETMFNIEARAFKDVAEVSLAHQAPGGWEVNYSKEVFSLAKGQAHTCKVTLKPLLNAKAGKIIFTLNYPGGSETLLTEEVRYEHIPDQNLFATAAIGLVPLNLQASGGRLLYIEGSGDEVDESLELVGYQVDKTPLEELSLEELKQYKAVVTGVRAFNTNDELAVYHQKLLDYVNQGGTWIAQYNTSQELKLKQFGPYPMEIGRDRVTEEGAEARLLNEKHKIFQAPHVIGSMDFEGWVQERGLYFATSWDAAYEPLIGWHDTGEEKDLQGGLLVAKHGKGAFIYTGISFFRQLPAGVPGAYRLFVNMIEYKP